MAAKGNRRTCTGIVVNYRTYGLLYGAVASVLRFYPGMRILVIDNTEPEFSKEIVDKRRTFDFDQVEVLRTGKNMGHGSGIDLGLRKSKSKVNFVFDSDIEVHTGGFVEEMIETVRNRPWYAIGQRGTFKGKFRVPYLHPFCCLLNRDMYFNFASFRNHGAPALTAMADIDRQDKSDLLVHFPIKKYIEHYQRGTREVCEAMGVSKSYK